mgnify:FL=1
MNRFRLLGENLHQLVIAIDQLLNCVYSVIVGLLNGTHRAYADETFSAYLWRRRFFWYVNVLRVIVDVIFMPFMKQGFKLTHCRLSYENELERKHLPKE